MFQTCYDNNKTPIDLLQVDTSNMNLNPFDWSDIEDATLLIHFLIANCAVVIHHNVHHPQNVPKIFNFGFNDTKLFL
jgi:hypothetical protein